MKKTITILLVILTLSNASYGKIWTVDNTGRVANFTNLTSAISGASAGDTLLLGGSPTAYADFSLTKKLCIIGTGFFLTENPNSIEYKTSVTISNITFSPGSGGSTLIGITCAVLMTISADNITVRRCYFTNGDLTINSNNNLIKQNYFDFGKSCTMYGGCYYAHIIINGTNNIIRNNYIQADDPSGDAIVCGPTNIIENNVISGVITVTSSSFGNNIIMAGTASFTLCDPYNNVCNDVQCGILNGNQSYVLMTSVFVDSGTSDGKFKLLSDSPAKGAGLGGIDCGMYGGNDPYVLSGIPDIPVITSIIVPGRAIPANGLNVILNIKSNK
jgi:hypothetical protein